MKLIQIVSTLAGGIIFILQGFTPAAANGVGCGSVIGPKETVVLEHDIGPCNTGAADWALKIGDRSTLDLNGHTVLCETTAAPVGILMAGERSTLMNGTVHYCSVGVKIDGPDPGRNRVENVIAEENTGQGFLITTSRNYLSGNMAVDNGAQGYSLWDIYSNRNKLIGNTAYDNGSYGFWVRSTGATLNLFEDNVAMNNHDGFANRGIYNKFIGNMSANNRFSGFFFDQFGRNSVLDGNIATNNNTNGMQVNGDGNLIENNRTDDNGRNGILLTIPAQHNNVTKNYAHSNVVYDLVDNNDNNGPGLCGTNVWSMNDFGTSSNPCIE